MTLVTRYSSRTCSKKHASSVSERTHCLQHKTLTTKRFPNEHTLYNIYETYNRHYHRTLQDITEPFMAHRRPPRNSEGEGNGSRLYKYSKDILVSITNLGTERGSTPRSPPNPTNSKTNREQ